jgi:hypothetical protein
MKPILGIVLGKLLKKKSQKESSKSSQETIKIIPSKNQLTPNNQPITDSQLQNRNIGSHNSMQ